MNEDILICILNYRHDEGAKKWLKLLSPHFKTVVLDSGNTHKVEEFIQYPNIYYSGLFNEVKCLNQEGNFSWVGIITSDIVFDEPNGRKIVEAIRSLKTKKKVGIYSIIGNKSGHSNRYQYSLDKKKFRYIEGFFQIIRSNILEEQDYIDTDVNLLGYGIDFTTCYLSNRMGYINFVDETIDIMHPKDKGYDKTIAIQQQKKYYAQMKERYNDYVLGVEELTKRREDIDGLRFFI